MNSNFIPGSMKAYVYILKSLKNSRFYIGSTDNLNRRIDEHNSGKSTYTSFSKPFELVFSQEYDELTMARKIEYWLKRQKDKKLIERIITEKKIQKTF